MTMLGLLGAAAGGVGEGMQRRRKEQAAVDLRMLDQKLSVELAKQQRAWDQADLQEGRSYNEGQLEKFSATLPPGVVAVPSGMKVTDTRQKRGGGGGGAGSSGKLSALQREQIKAVRDSRDKAEERYQESTDPKQQKQFMAEYQQYNNQYHSMIGMPQQQADVGGSGQPAPERDKDSFFSPFGVGTKEEAKGGEKAPEATPEKKQSGFQKKMAARQAAQQEKKKEIDKALKSGVYRHAMEGNEKAKRFMRSRLEKIKRNADSSVIKQINEILAGM